MRGLIALIVLALAIPCFAFSYAMNNFNTGAVSPKMEARTDFPRYTSSCRTLENFLVSAQGPIERRPGTKYICAVKDSNYAPRLLSFEHSTNDAYPVEAGNLYMRFYRNGAQILADDVNAYEIETPFTTGDLNNIQYTQNGNTMYIVDGNHPLQVLNRYDHNNWSCSDASITTGPFLPENKTTITITPSGYDNNNVTQVVGSVYSASIDTAKAAFAFDGIISNSDGWFTSNGNIANQWIEVNLPSAKTVTKIKIQPCYNASYPTHNVRRCKIEASADDSTWVKLPVISWSGRCKAYDTNEIEIEQIANLTDWAEVIVSNSTGYQFYRVYLYDNWGDDVFLSLNEIEMYEGVTTLVASSDIFDGNHVGSIWEISQKRENSTVDGRLDADGNSDPTPFFKGGYGFTTSGTWIATVTLERSTDGVTWEAALVPLARTAVNTGPHFNNPAETEEEGAYYRVSMEDYTSGHCDWHFMIQDKYNHGVVKVISFTDANEVNAMVLTALEDSSATTKWREGYWSDYRGWPKTIEFHQQRLVLGGSRSYPQTIWFGKQDATDHLNFSEGTLDTDAFSPALQGYNPIKWLLSQDFVFIGTSGSVGKYGDEGKPITHTSPSYREQTQIGSADIRAVVAGDSQIYIERNNKKVRGFNYVLQYDKYDSPDFTVFSEDVTESGIKEIAVQARPDTVLWCILNDGNMATLTYLRDQEVMGWSKQITNGKFESIARIPGVSEDEIWVSTARTINSSTKRYIEQFQPRDWGSDNNNCWFVDCGGSYNGVDINTVTNMSYLEGKIVSVYAEGNDLTDKTVSSGSISLGSQYGNLVAGLPYTSKMETLPITAETQNGSIATYYKQITFINFDFLKSGYLQFSNGSDANVVTYDLLGKYHGLKTSTNEYEKYNFPGNPKVKQTVYVQTDRPLPLCIRALIPVLGVQ